MSISANLIPRSGLKWIPRPARIGHDLHDEYLLALRDYGETNAHVVTINFKDEDKAALFNATNSADVPIAAMGAAGYTWTVVPVGRRAEYIAALEQGSTASHIDPFADFFSGLVREQMA